MNMAEHWLLEDSLYSLVEVNEHSLTRRGPSFVGYALPALAGGPSPRPLLLWWALLLGLSSLARYEPAVWTTAIDLDASPLAAQGQGQKFRIERVRDRALGPDVDEPRADQIGPRLQDHCWSRPVASDRLAAAWMRTTNGLRRGEVLGLCWEDVDLERGEIVIRQALLDVAGEVQHGPTKSERGRPDPPPGPVPGDGLGGPSGPATPGAMDSGRLGGRLRGTMLGLRRPVMSWWTRSARTPARSGTPTSSADWSRPAGSRSTGSTMPAIRPFRSCSAGGSRCTSWRPGTARTPGPRRPSMPTLRTMG